MDQLLRSAETHIKQGADWLDIGAQSSRPGAQEISINQELETLVTAVKSIKDSLNVSLIISGSEQDIDFAMNTGHINEEERNLVKKYLESNELYSLGFTNMTDLIKAKFPRLSIVNG